MDHIPYLFSNFVRNLDLHIMIRIRSIVNVRPWSENQLLYQDHQLYVHEGFKFKCDLCDYEVGLVDFENTPKKITKSKFFAVDNLFYACY